MVVLVASVGYNITMFHLKLLIITDQRQCGLAVIVGCRLSTSETQHWHNNHRLVVIMYGIVVLSAQPSTNSLNL